MSQEKLEVKVLIWTHKNQSSLFCEMFREFLKSVPAALTFFKYDGGRFGHAAIEIPLPNENTKLYISLFKRGLDEFRARISDYTQFSSDFDLSVYRINLSKQDIINMLSKLESITGGYTKLYNYRCTINGNTDKDAESKIIAYPINVTRRSIFQSCRAEGFPNSGENCTSLVVQLLNETNLELNYRPNRCILLMISFITGAAAAWSTGDFARALKSHTDHEDLPLSLAAVALFATQGGWIILSSLGRCCSLDLSYEDRIYICSILIEIGLALADLIVEAKSGAMNSLTDAATYTSDPENFWGYGIGIGAAALVTYSLFTYFQLGLYASYRPSLLNRVLKNHVTDQINKQPTEEYYREWLQRPTYDNEQSAASVFHIGEDDSYHRLNNI